jgi:hypothetical protein
MNQIEQAKADIARERAATSFHIEDMKVLFDDGLEKHKARVRLEAEWTETAVDLSSRFV